MLLLRERLPVVVQVTSIGFVSSMMSTFTVMVGGSDLIERYTNVATNSTIIWILFAKCRELPLMEPYNYTNIRRISLRTRDIIPNCFAT